MKGARDTGTLILRLGLSAFMLPHGLKKFSRLFDEEISFADPIGVGPEVSLILTLFAEVLCSALVMVGFKTRWAAVPLLLTMAVAAFIVHAGDPWDKKEMALVYFTGFLALVFLGSGKFSLDYLVSRKSRRR